MNIHRLSKVTVKGQTVDCGTVTELLVALEIACRELFGEAPAQLQVFADSLYLKHFRNLGYTSLYLETTCLNTEGRGQPVANQAGWYALTKKGKSNV